MFTSRAKIRTAAEVPTVEGVGWRCRRHFGDLIERDERGASSEHGFGALRVFDDVVLDAGARLELAAHDGLEVVVYLLDGQGRLEDDRGHASDLARDGAACSTLGHGVRHVLVNRGESAPLHVVVAAIVAPQANPRPRLATASFAHDAPGVAWFASHGPDDTARGALELGLRARVGVALLDPGFGHVFPQVPDGGVYCAVVEGYLEVSPSSFVENGGDMRAPVGEAPIRIQGVARTRAIVLEIPFVVAQELMESA